MVMSANVQRLGPLGDPVEHIAGHLILVGGDRVKNALDLP